MQISSFYYIYGLDAYNVGKIIDMKLCRFGKWNFVYFHKGSLARFTPLLLASGYKLVVMEQMEEYKDSHDDIIRREACQVLTRGTYIETNPSDYSSKFLMCIFEKNSSIGIVYLDTTTHEFYIGEFQDDINKSSMRTILYRIKPVEVCFSRDHISKETISMLQGLSNKPTLSPIIRPTIDLDNIFIKMRSYFEKRNEGENTENFPLLLKNMKDSVELEFKNQPQSVEKIPSYFTLQALNISLEYLEHAMLAETVFTMGNFLAFDIAIEKATNLYLDSQTLQNLEIIEVSYLTSLNEANSLLQFMDRTKSPYGKRMFKKWLTSPLTDITAINDRLDAIEDLMKNEDIADYYQNAISKLPDLERMINKIYNLNNKQRMSSIQFEDIAVNRLHDFLDYLKELKKVEGIIEYFNDYKHHFQSKRLRQLTTFKDIDIEEFNKKRKSSKKSVTIGIFPRINDIISDLEGMIQLQDKIPIPAPGINKESDIIRKKIDDVKAELNKILEHWRKYFKGETNINFVASKYRYEIEIPERLVEGNKRPDTLLITSKRKGYLRFHSTEIEQQLSRLHHLERDFKSVLVPFIVDYFKKLYERNAYWLQVISCLAELDCLCGLAKLASSFKKKCRPVLKNSEELIFDLKGMVHPCVSKDQPNFVPNDVILEQPVQIFLVTGPNMGGKSTLLRQTCIAAIMAQMGSFVTAESFVLSPIDRIFTRIGASDRIFEGKSTFYVEMEETLQIVNEATNKSLIIIDELGRGTSTYDGVAIAYAVLKYLAEHTKCLTLFATHYHLLLEEFKLYSNIGNFHMSCELDQVKDEVKFLYKFIKGQASNSYGITIAKMAGLPKAVVELGREKAEFMNKEKRNISYEKSLIVKFNKLIEFLNNIENYDDFDDKFVNEAIQLLEEIH